MRILKNDAVVQRFVPTHPESKCMPHEYLLSAFACGKSFDEVECILDWAVEIFISRIDDFTGRVHWSIKF
jgi:hypothetical protein